MGTGVNVVGDGATTPFAEGSFDEVVSLNPYRYQPVSAETARLLGPGGTLRVAGAPQNQFMTVGDDIIKEAGLEVVYSGPSRPGDIFGVMTRTDGSPIHDYFDYVTVVYRVTG